MFRDDEFMINLYRKHDVIFQDCEFSEYEGSVHAQFINLCKLPEDVNSKTIRCDLPAVTVKMNMGEVWAFITCASDLHGIHVFRVIHA